jgi:glycerol-3-phosphate dehydrogenase
VTDLHRPTHLQRLREESFDVVVIGGGITGAGVARDAARRGYRTALVEARDFGEGTSSRSSRLIHGGLRYLEHFEFDLVFEASKERRTLLEIAPHLVRPLEFVYPLYEEGRVGRRKLDAGMWLYDALSLFRNIERHQMLDADEVLAREPHLRAEGLLGGARYYDAQVDDARLVLLTVLGAAQAGAAVANRLEAVEIVRRAGAVDGVRVRPAGGADEGRGEAVAAWTVDARLVVNATGPWTDATRELAGVEPTDLLRPTRGTHVLIPRDRLDHRRALIFESPLDGRIMFVLPWADYTLIGTTDVDYEGDPADVVPTADDVAYLLESTRRLFPGAGLEASDVLSAWAGLRPLVQEEDAEDEGQVSREFSIVEGPPGLLTITGGKLTSHRHMAEELVDRAAAFLARAFDLDEREETDTDRVPLPGGDFEDLEAFEASLAERAADHRLAGRSIERLARAHGTGAGRVLELVSERSGLREPVVDGHPYLAAEVVHAARHEMAVHAEDVLFRRTQLGREAGDGFGEACRRVVELMADELEWDPARQRREAERAGAVRAADEGFRAEMQAAAD